VGGLGAAVGAAPFELDCHHLVVVGGYGAGDIGRLVDPAVGILVADSLGGAGCVVLEAQAGREGIGAAAGLLGGDPHPEAQAGAAEAGIGHAHPLAQQVVAGGVGDPTEAQAVEGGVELVGVQVARSIGAVVHGPGEDAAGIKIVVVQQLLGPRCWLVIGGLQRHVVDIPLLEGVVVVWRGHPEDQLDRIATVGVQRLADIDALGVPLAARVADGVGHLDTVGRAGREVGAHGVVGGSAGQHDGDGKTGGAVPTRVDPCREAVGQVGGSAGQGNRLRQGRATGVDGVAHLVAVAPTVRDGTADLAVGGVGIGPGGG